MIRLGQPKPAAGGTTRGPSKHGALRQRTLEGSVECVLGGLNSRNEPQRHRL